MPGDASRRRRLAGALALALAALLLVVALVATDAQDLEQAYNAPEDASLLVARTPAVARYDPDSDTTLAAFQCAHHYCRVAVRIAGDARGTLDAGSILLRAPADAPLREVGPIEPPLRAQGFMGEQTIGNATAATFHIVPRAPVLALRGAPVVLGVAGALLARGAPTQRALVAAAATAVAFAVAPIVIAEESLAGDIRPALAVLALAVIAIALVLLAPRFPTLREASAPAVGIAIGYTLGLALALPLYAHAPLL